MTAFWRSRAFMRAASLVAFGAGVVAAAWYVALLFLASAVLAVCAGMLRLAAARDSDDWRENDK